MSQSSTSAVPPVSNPAQLDLPTRTPSRKWTTAALLLLMVLASMESTVTSTAMPTIIGDLQGLEHYSWVASIYLLASTATMPIYGWLSDRLGRKRVLLVALALFALGSLLASLARSMPALIAFRGIQGLGAGGIMPIVLTVLGDIFTIQERAKIQGVFSAVWGSAALAGPALGAFLVNTSHLAPYFPNALQRFLGWPTIFWVNLPAGLAGALVLIFKYHDHHHRHATPAARTPHLSASADRAAAPPARRSVLQVLTSPVILPSITVSALLGVGVYALDTYVPLYVQGGRGMSAAAAAATVTPVMLAWASSGIFAAPLLLRWGFRKLAVVGSSVGLLGFVGLIVGVLLKSSPFFGSLSFITVSLFFSGLGFGPASMAILLAAQNDVTYEYRGIATSAITLCRNLGGAVGVSLFGLLFNLLTATQLQRTSSHFQTSDLLNPHRLAELQQDHPAELHQAQSTIATGLLWVFLAMLVVAAVQILVSRALPVHLKPPHKPTASESLEAIAG